MNPEMMRELVAWARSQPAIGLSDEKFPEWYDRASHAALDSQRERKIASRAGAIAVVPVFGVIEAKNSIFARLGLAASTEMVSQGIRAALADTNVKAVVLDIDSPGGAVSGVPELAAEIRSLRGGDKPIIAQVDYLAASAAYWIASAADEIVASPSAYVGSVGVYSLHVDQSKFLEEIGFKVTLIAEPDEKIEGNPFEPLSDTARAEIAKRVAQAADIFRGDVAQGRGMRRNQVTAQWARVFTAAEALDMGMIDKVRSLRGTLERLGMQAEGDHERRRARIAAQRERDFQEAVALGRIPELSICPS